MLRKPLGSAKRSFALAARIARPSIVGANTAAGDMSVVMQAECDDSTLPSAAVTTSAEVIQQSPEALLNHANLPLLVPFLSLLHRRGALNNGRARQEIVRFMVPSVHHDFLPWMWENGTGPLDVKTEVDVSEFRSLPPFVWRTTIKRSKPGDLEGQLHYWHQIFFALLSNAAFAQGETFDSAHQELLGLLDDYYADVMHIQKFLPPLDEGIIVTRLPPVLVRKLRKLYMERCRLMQYAEFFRTAVDGEERVMPIGGTAMLNDAEVFEYYLTIPGRRDSGMERERRWPSTVKYAVFAFEKLFRQRFWRRTSVAAVVTRPATLLMNVCVFARNDNAEGERYREAILAVMRAFRAHCGAYSRHGADNHEDKADCVALLRVLRDAGLESMIAKCRRLHFGPMRGLLDVCTVATVVEMILAGEVDGETDSFSHTELEMFLSPRKIIGNELYDATRGHSHHRVAACYGLLNLNACVSTALQEVLKPGLSMDRYCDELARWGALIGRPLRLSPGDVPSSSVSSPLFSPRQQQGADGDLISSWKCGCQCLNPSKKEILSCIDCVLRDKVEHQWRCPHCLWMSTSGDRIDSCLGCNRPHPGKFVMRPSGANGGTMNRKHVTPLLWYCDWCSSFSPIYSEGATTACSCMECGAIGSGWSTGFFEWQCGCGKVNSPFRRWCTACSVRQRHACCMCGTCGKEWKMHPRTAAPSLAFGDRCPSCMDLHPRDAAARQRRLLRCPFCHHLTIDGDVECQNCEHAIGVLRQFLPLESDWPWLCHVCGHRHHHRDTDEEPHSPLSSQPRRDACTETCGSCGAIRIHPVVFHTHEMWSCTKCGKRVARGFNCSHCFSLHPAVPATEVHAWRCVVCLTINNSWESSCRRSGCGTRRLADSTVLSYTPWCCTTCGKWNRTAQVPQCEHCNAVRAVTVPFPASECTAEEKWALRLSEVEVLLEKAAAVGEDVVDTPDPICGDTPTDDWLCCLSDAAQLAIPLS